MGFIPWHHLMLVKDFKAIELGLAMNGLNSPIEGHGVYICNTWKVCKKNSNVMNAQKKL
jgi:hypothetical protein